MLRRGNEGDQGMSIHSANRASIAGGLARDPLRRDRSDGIDLLRALCAIWVVMAHLVPWTPIAQGAGTVPAWLTRADRLLLWIFQPALELHPAVLAFIVLSGYCIHRGGLRTRGAGEVTGYAIRRFFRIAPVYYLAIGAGLLGFLLSRAVSPSLIEVLSSTTRIAGSCLAAKAFALPAFSPGWYECTFLGNAPLITVLVEIVLYILYAAVFAGLVWRGREWLIWLVCGGIFLASVVAFARGVDPGFYRWWQNGAVFGFLPYWWVGVGFVNPTFAAACRRRLWLIALVWVALTLLLLFTAPPAMTALAEIRKLSFALGIGVLIRVLDDMRLKHAGPFALIGRSGYGLYAIHAPLSYTLAIYGLRWWAIVIADVLAGLILHWVIERPLIELGRAVRLRLSSRSVAAPVRAAP